MAHPFEEHSDRNGVRGEISRGGWTVIWGKHFVAQDYVEVSVAIASGSAIAYFGNLLQEIVEKFGLGLVKLLMENRGAVVWNQETEFCLGVATYRYWHEIYNPLRLRKEKVALAPNTHQIYLKYRNAPLSATDAEIVADSPYLAGELPGFRISESVQLLLIS